MGALRQLISPLRTLMRRNKAGQFVIRKAKRIRLELYKLFHPHNPQTQPSRAQLESLLKGRISIVSNNYCMYVARAYACQLKSMGYDVEVSNQLDQEWGDGLYLLVGPQWFHTFPKHYISIQLEQLQASTWYGARYYRILRGSLGIFDYNRDDLAFLAHERMGAVPLQYLPITIIPGQNIQKPDTPRPYDVLFYGSMEHDRRKNAIALLQKHFNVKVVVGCFGEELHNELRNAKIIINIHDWDKALLETTRLFECLSLGLFVVSEDSSNSGDFPTLRENLSWFDEGDWEGMIAEVGKWLADDKAREEERVRRYTRALAAADSFADCFQAYLEAHKG